MRHLTVKQKNLLNKFFNSMIETDKTKVYINDTPFKNLQYHIGVEDVSAELYAQLEAINDTEILYQNVDRYLQDKSSDYINTH